MRSTQYYTSFRVAAKVTNPRILLDTKSWPEGAFIKRWYPRRTPPGNQNTVYEVSDNTMVNIKVPGPNDNPVIVVEESADSADSFHSAKNVSLPISDRTMGSVKYNFPHHLIHGSDSDSDGGSAVKSPTDLFELPKRKHYRKTRASDFYSHSKLRSPVVTRSRSRSALSIACRGRNSE